MPLIYNELRETIIVSDCFPTGIYAIFAVKLVRPIIYSYLCRICKKYSYSFRYGNIQAKTVAEVAALRIA